MPRAKKDPAWIPVTMTLDPKASKALRDQVGCFHGKKTMGEIASEIILAALVPVGDQTKSEPSIPRSAPVRIPAQLPVASAPGLAAGGSETPFLHSPRHPTLRTVHPKIQVADGDTAAAPERKGPTLCTRGKVASQLPVGFVPLTKEELRQAMKTLGLTQVALAEEFGLVGRTIGEWWEHGIPDKRQEQLNSVLSKRGWRR